jgi:hypothetical protein
MEPSSSQDRFSPLVADVLRKSGWFAGRDVSQSFFSPPEFALFPEAEEVLKEFGGLRLGSCGAGVDFATSDVVIDPGLATHLKEELKGYEHSVKAKLFPLGEVHRGHGYLVIDEQGRVYLLSDELAPFASTFSRSLEMLLLGKNAKPEEIEAAWGREGKEKARH